MKPRLIVALDPGGATGWAELSEDGTVSLSVIGDKHTVCERMDHVLSVTHGVQVVMESFVPRPNVTFVSDSLHIIGTVFDHTMIEGQRGHDSQTINLAPSQGGWVDFSLDAPGSYPFVDHSFAGMMKGAAGAFTAVGRAA